MSAQIEAIGQGGSALPLIQSKLILCSPNARAIAECCIVHPKLMANNGKDYYIDHQQSGHKPKVCHKHKALQLL
jgi:hypothetical protein